MTVPALDVLREMMRTGRQLAADQRHPVFRADYFDAGERAVADLDALVQAARNYLRSDVWIDGHPLQGKSLGPDTGTTTSEALRDALLRVTGEAR